MFGTVQLHPLPEAAHALGVEGFKPHPAHQTRLTGDKLLPLAAAAAVPHGADGVDRIPAGQAIGLGDLGIAGLAAAQRPALGQ